MKKERLESRKRLARRLLSQDSWGEAMAMGTDRKHQLAEGPRKAQLHLLCA